MSQFVQLQGIMVSFHANRVACSVELGLTVVTLDEVGEGAEYLMFQRAREDEGVGDTGVYLERRGQGWAARGGIIRCELHRNRLRLRVKKQTAMRLGGGAEYEVTFELPYREFRTLRSRLRTVFRGFASFADRSAGERLARRPRNTFAESLDRMFGDWFGPASLGDGCTHTLVRESEEYTGFRIPRPLRDYYLRFGEHKVSRGARGMLLTPESLEVEEGRVVFWMGHEEDGGGAWCGVRSEALGRSDPPVERQVFVSDDETVWVPECRRLSWFLLRAICWQAVWGLPHRAFAELTPVVREKLASRLTLVAPEQPLDQEMVAYAGEGLAVCALPKEGILRVGARTAERLRWLQRELGTKLRVS